MADTFTVKVHGLEELERELNALPEKFAKTALRTASRKAGQLVQREAMARAPKSGLPIPRGGKDSRWRTVPLSKGIRVTTRVKGEGVRGGTIETHIGIIGRVFYGRFLEFGTKFMSKRPFLGPAFEALRGTILDTFKLELRKAIGRIKVKNKLP